MASGKLPPVTKTGLTRGAFVRAGQSRTRSATGAILPWLP